jgi:hypothetical protein
MIAVDKPARRFFNLHHDHPAEVVGFFMRSIECGDE